ncbi:hypothetical protein YC2023_057861 [Brassica napus]
MKYRRNSEEHLIYSSIDAFLDIYPSIDPFIPRDMFLGIFRTFFYKRIDRWIYVQKRIDRRSSEEISRRRSPSVYSEELSDELVVLGISSEICFLGILSENSEGFPSKEEIPRSYF